MRNNKDKTRAYCPKCKMKVKVRAKSSIEAVRSQRELQMAQVPVLACTLCGHVVKHL